MKIKKIYETSADDIFKSIADYNQLLILLKPIVLKEYYRLANKDYHPDYGDTPDKSISDHDLYISELSISNRDEILVIVSYRTEYNTEEYYIYLSRKKIEKGLLELTANKYNL